MKLLGAVLILAACTIWALKQVRQERSRIRELFALYEMLELMQGELESRTLPIPELLDILSHTCSGEAGRFAESLGRQMPSLGELPFSDLWALSVRKCFTWLPENLMHEMTTLGASLGRFELARQCEAIQCCAQSVRREITQRESELPKRRRLALALPMASGGLLVIILF